MQKKRTWRAGAGLVLGLLAPVLVLTACTAEDRSADPARAGTATATSVPTTPPSATPAEEAPGDSGGDRAQPEGAATPGGTDTCGGATVCGVAGQPALWDPCGISDADISAQGFRPESRSAFPGPGAGDLNCRWRSVTGPVELTIISVQQTVDGFRQSGAYLDFTQLTIGGRTAHQFRAAQDTNRIGCYVGFAVPGGTVAFVTKNLPADNVEDPCVVARRIGGALAGYLP